MARSVYNALVRSDTAFAILAAVVSGALVVIARRLLGSLA